MPQRDDYAMIIYGFYKEFDWGDDESHSEHMEKWGLSTAKALGKNWSFQCTTAPVGDKEKVFVFLKESKHSVGSRCGTFYTNIQLIPSQPKCIDVKREKYKCGWHLVMWGPYF